MTSNLKKLILVIGATGAQGLAVIDALLASGADGSPSPFSVRALTRDPSSERAQSLRARGVECFKGITLSFSSFVATFTRELSGTFDDFHSVAAAFNGVYGAWVNTDGFTVGRSSTEVYPSSLCF